ncbi:MAG TPA: spore germination protein [Bacillota bacterium]|nr:spore germination protein [Bacillota bacterium]
MLFEKFFNNAGASTPAKMPEFKRTKSSVPEERELSGDLDQDLNLITQAIGKPADLVIHKIFNLDGNQQPMVSVMYLKSLTDGPALGFQVIDPLNRYINENKQDLTPAKTARLLAAAEVLEYQDLRSATNSLLTGNALLFFPGCKTALAVDFPGFPRRQIEEPKTESVIRGPREGFTEVLTDNLGLIRRSIKDPNLRVEKLFLGERTKTEINVLFLLDVANPDIVAEVKKRLQRINIDGILDSGYITGMISDQRWTLFPLVQETERPDKVSAAILEGRVAILMDKTPFVLIVPVTSTEFYQTSEDFFLNFWIGAFIRYIRGIGTFISVTLPGLYVSLVAVNPTMMPVSLTHIISSGRTQVPIPVIFETALVFLIFEIFREAVLRVPPGINQILGISGGLLIGLIAVNSGMVSGATVIVVIISVLASFTTAIVSKEQAWRVVRYFLLFAGGSFGILGLTLAGILVLNHMASLKSFGVTYLGPWAPPLFIDIVDAYFVLPWWLSFRRPPIYRPQQEDRLGTTRLEPTKEDEE